MMPHQHNKLNSQFDLALFILCFTEPTQHAPSQRGTTLWKNVLPLSSEQKKATITICKGLQNFLLFTNY